MTLSYENLLPFRYYGRRQAIDTGPAETYGFLSFQDAMHYLVKAYRLQGKTVLVPGFYCPETLADMRKHGLKTVLCRVDHEKFDVELEDFEAKLVEYRPEIIVLYNFFGKNSLLYSQTEWRKHLRPDAWMISDLAHSLLPLHRLEFLSEKHVYIDSTRKTTSTMMAHMVAPPGFTLQRRYITRLSWFRWYIRLLFAAKTLLLRGARMLDSRRVGDLAMKLYMRHDSCIGTPTHAFAGFPLDAWLYRHMDFQAVAQHRRAMYPLYREQLQPLADAGHIILFDIPAGETGNLCFFFFSMRDVGRIPELASTMEKKGFWVDRLWDFDAMEGMEEAERKWAASVVVCPLTVQTIPEDIRMIGRHLQNFFEGRSDG